MSDVEAAITRVHRDEWARVIAGLTRRFGDLDLAEEAAAEAFATAVERWPADGVPPNPGAWLTTTAHRKAIDRIRRESKRDAKQTEAQMSYDDDLPDPLGDVRSRCRSSPCAPRRRCSVREDIVGPKARAAHGLSPRTYRRRATYLTRRI